MIDYEVKIFNEVHSAVSTVLANGLFVSTPILDLAKLPAATLYEMDNTTVRRRQGTALEENFARVTYQMRVAASTKAACRKIYAALDEKMIQLNFSRISGQYMTYPGNKSVVEYVARYEAEIDAEGRIYRIV